MINLIRCLRCGKIMTAEEYGSHICSFPLKDVKRIEIDYYYETKTDKNETMIIARGRDGILYQLVKSQMEE